MPYAETVVLTITGAEAKALCSDPSNNQSEDIVIPGNLLGTVSGEPVIITEVVTETTVAITGLTWGASLKLLPSYHGGYACTWAVNTQWQQEYTGIKHDGGPLPARLLIDPGETGKHLSDIPDSAELRLHLTCSRVSDYPGVGKRSFATPSRSLDSAFQIDADRDADVSYSVQIASALSLTTGQQGTVYLKYADDSAFTTNVKEVCRFVNGNTGTLSVGLGLTQTVGGTLSGTVPAGKYVKLVTENNTGTPTFTLNSSQEVLL